MRSVFIVLATFFALKSGLAASGQWTPGMDDDAGKAAATSSTDLPAADFTGMRHIYPKRDRLFTTSLDGTWAFKLVNGLATPDELKGWNEPGYDTREWDDIQVPGNWETQGLKSPQYGNQIDEMSGFYVRNFRWNYRWEGQRVILRFDGVLFGYEVWLNGKYVGRWGSAYNMAQWDVTDKLVKGRNTIAVKVITRSHGWLFDTNDCWALAGIFRSVELFTVPNDYVEDVVFRTEELGNGEAVGADHRAARHLGGALGDLPETGADGNGGLVGADHRAARHLGGALGDRALPEPNTSGNEVSNETGRTSNASVTISVSVGSFDEAASKAKKVYVSLLDDNGVHVLDFERGLPNKDSRQSAPDSRLSAVECRGVVPNAHLWSVDDPYLYTLVVTLVDAQGNKIERIAEPQGLRIVRLVDRHLEINDKHTFLNGVAWNEIDPVLGRAITETERRRQMTLMKKAGVNCIRTAHYPFGPDFLCLADEMGFYVIDEIPFGSRGEVYLRDKSYRDELIVRTEATMRRDKNHASVIFWTFGNENGFTSNTEAVLAYAKAKDPTRPRGLPQIGSSQGKETMYHPERNVDFIAPHYLSPENMREYEKNATKPLIQTEFAHACGNGFNDFEDRYRRMRANTNVWMGGCVWAWIDQSIMHDEHNDAFEKELSLSRTFAPHGRAVSMKPPQSKDLRRDLPREFQGNYVDERHFIDSWGDRATDGIVYGDGTPKDGYWLVRALYTGANQVESSKSKVESWPPPQYSQITTLNSKLAAPLPYLRVGRKRGLVQAIHAMGDKKAFLHDQYLVKPEVFSETGDETNKTYRIRWVIDSDADNFIDGTITVSIGRAVSMKPPHSASVVSYTLTSSEKCLRDARFAELGLALFAEGDRVDWVGDGPLTSVPGKSKMNIFRKWAMHKDDYRFAGNRSNVKWAAVGSNGSAAQPLVVESETGNVSFENVDGRICLTENFAVAGYGGKASGPGSLKSPKDINMKGSFTVYAAELDAPPSDVVPDLTFTSHYGF